MPCVKISVVNKACVKIIVEEPSGPNIIIEDVWTNKTEYYEDEDVWVYAKLVNKGDERGKIDLKFTVDGSVVTREAVYLDPGKNLTVGYKVGKLLKGKHEVCVDEE